MRERIFTPRLRVGNLDALNALLMDRCVAHARAHRHPALDARFNGFLPGARSSMETAWVRPRQPG